jgi:hypothetical protein
MSLCFIDFQWLGFWAVDKLHFSHQILTIDLLTITFKHVHPVRQ